MSFSASKKALLGKEKGGALKIFLMAVVCAACFFVPYMIIDGGYFLFFGDFNVQQIPFYQLCHEAIRSGEIGWNFNTDLGANFIGSYTFYTITSPFFWLTLPFPNSWVPYFMGPLLILKFGLAALTSFLYIRRFTRRDASAQIGSLLYAFSGFSIYNVFFNHFHEAIVFFPLLLLAFELLVTEGRRGVFALAIAVCAIVNYFFFVGMLVFGIIYFAARMISGAIKPKAGMIVSVFLEAILGIAISAVILLPSYLAIADNSRVSELNLGWNSLLFGKESIYANVFAVFFMPPDLPARPVLFPESDVKWSSLGAWMPVFSMVGVFAYVAAKKGSWIKRVLITCAVMAFVPILNSAFYAFNNSYYVRWFYMPILIMALATSIAVEDLTISFKKAFKQVFAITLGITLIIGFFPNTKSGKLQLGIFTQPDNTMYIARFWITCFIAIASLLVLSVLLNTRRENMKVFLKNSLIAVVVVAIGFSNFFIASGKSHSYTHYAVVDQLIEGELALEGEADTFRIDTFDCMDNTAMFLGYSSINAFHSVVPPSIMEFYEFVGEKRDVASRPTTDNYALRPLLSVKYLLRNDREDNFSDAVGNTKMPGYTYLFNDNGFDVYENENYIGYGFSYDAYLSLEDCEHLSGTERARAMLSAVLLDAAQIQKYGYMFETYSEYVTSAGHSASLSYESVKKECLLRAQTAATSFSTDKNSFTATVSRDKDTLVFFSIPYDSGWTAYVNGVETEIEEVNIGFMAVPVSAGESKIEFRYKTPGLAAGAIISLSALGALIIYLAVCFVYTRKHTVAIYYPEGEQLLARFTIELAEEQNTAEELYIEDSNNL